MYNRRINNSTNKMKTIWNIIKAETNRVKETTNIDHNTMTYMNGLKQTYYL